MMRALILFTLAVALGLAQQKPQAAAKAEQPEMSEADKAAAAQQEELSDALAEAGSSPIEFLRAIEKHLAKYPQTKRRAELERAATRAAMEAKDDKRILTYGERVLARDPDDLAVLERVIRALLAVGTVPPNGTAQPAHEETGSTASVMLPGGAVPPGPNQRALNYSRHFEELLARMRKEGGPEGSKAEWQDELDHALGRALLFQARACANLGRSDDALGLAQRAWDAWATADAAREWARALEGAGHREEAAARLADALTVADARNTDEDRARDRAKMGELYRAAKGSDAGLGDLFLRAYDRSASIVDARKLRARQADPNAAAATLFDFTVAAVDGSKLPLATLKGKTLVMDFWATWCGPCRVQHPLYEEVKKTFHDNGEVVFLSVNSDEDREAVKPFLDDVKWKGPVYYEDRLSRVLHISSLPTTVIVDKHGEVFSRMNGFVPERFVSMLTERIRDALAN